MLDHSQEQVKYNKIMMLVHPMYDLIFHYFPKKTKISSTMNLPAAFVKRFKILFGAYGKALLDASKDPNVCVIIVEPNF